MTVKKNDFIEIEYTGRDRESEAIFDTTDKKAAQQEEIYNKSMDYGPVIICLGQSHILQGLDDRMMGKELGTYTFELGPEEAFGNKNPRMIQLIATNRFRKEGINPVPGLVINADSMQGIIKTVSGGRTLVDFNHPLAGKEVSYSITIRRIVTDDKEKLDAILRNRLGIKHINTQLSEGKATVKTKYDIPESVSDVLSQSIRELIPAIREISFTKENASPTENKQTQKDKKEQ